MQACLRSFIIAVSAFGCRENDSTATRASLAGTGQLTQVVRLTPERPAPNQEVTIASTVFNRGRAPVEFSSRICGLDTKGDIALTGSLLMCAGYSMSGRLEPGDSIVGFDARVVASPPGRYTLRIRHLMNPEQWVEVPVDVR